MLNVKAFPTFYFSSSSSFSVFFWSIDLFWFSVFKVAPDMYVTCINSECTNAKRVEGAEVQVSLDLQLHWSWLWVQQIQNVHLPWFVRGWNHSRKLQPLRVRCQCSTGILLKLIAQTLCIITRDDTNLKLVICHVEDYLKKLHWNNILCLERPVHLLV